MDNLRDDILFAVTKEHLETGLRGVPVGFCATSSVDPKKGLYYRGRDISSLARFAPERVMYLIFNGEEGSMDQVQAFTKELKTRAFLSQSAKKHIRQLPREGSVMKLLKCALGIVAMMEGCGDYYEDALNIMAKMPEIVAAVINHHAGWGQAPAVEGDLSMVEHFIHLLQSPEKKDALLSEAMRLFAIVHFDHGGGNLSAFVGKAVASGLEDMYGALMASVSALSGLRHGSANRKGVELIKQVHTLLGGKLDEKELETLVHAWLKEGDLIYGFGHAVLQVEDPRASLLYDFASSHAQLKEHELIKTALFLRSQMPSILSKKKKIKSPYPNVDAISGALLAAAGFDYPEYFTPLFALFRSVGIVSQIVYERTHARGGKGTPILRPRYLPTT